MSGFQLPTLADPNAFAGRTYTPAQALDVGSMQLAIAAQLRAFFASSVPPLPIDVYVFPNFDKDKWWVSESIAMVVIGYDQTTLGKPDATSSMVQEREVELVVHVEARTVAWALSGDGSVYALIHAIESSLTGFQPLPGVRNAYFTAERFQDQDAEGGVWLYDMHLRIITRLPKLEPRLALALLRKAVFNDVSGESQNPPDQVIAIDTGGKSPFVPTN